MALHGATAADKPLPSVEVFIPGLCLACLDWAEHLRQNGFPDVQVKEVADMAALKKKLKGAGRSGVGAYRRGRRLFCRRSRAGRRHQGIVEAKPKARGIAVPGLPRGAPGREFSMPSCETGCTMLDAQTPEREIRREMFNTMLVGKDGKTSVWARH